MRLGWKESVLALAVVAVSGVLGYWLISAVLSASRQTTGLLESTRPVILTAEEAALGLPLRSESSGWNLVQFMDYSCEHCRSAEDRINKELPAAAPNVGRVLVLWPNPQSFETWWGARTMLAFRDSDALTKAMHHRNLLQKSSIDFHATLTERPPTSISGRVQPTESDWKEILESQEITDHIKATDALAKRLGLAGVPAYLLVGPDGKGWIVGTLDEWIALAKEQGLGKEN